MTTRIKVWDPGEILFASDLNDEFDNIINNASTGNVIATGSVTAISLADRAAREYWLEDFGSGIGSGTADDSTVIQLALDTVGAAGGGILRCANHTYAYAATLIHQYNNVLLKGGGQGSQRQGSTDYLTAATLFKWIGAAGATTYDMGPLAGAQYNLKGGGIEGIFFEGGGVAGTMILMRSIHNARFRFIARETTGFLVDITTEETLTTDPTDTQNNWFESMTLIQDTVGSGGCLRLGGGVIGAGSEGNSSLNHFGTVRCLHYNGDAVDMGNTDNNLFDYTATFRNAAGTGIGVLLRASDTSQHARYNTFCHLEAGKGGLTSEGLGKGTKAAQQHTVVLYSRANANPAPITEYGASLSYVSALGTTRVSRDDSTAVTELHRATHTAGQVIGKFQFAAYDDGDAEQVYGYIDAQNRDVTAGAEQGTVRINTTQASVATTIAQWSDGMIIGVTPSGSFQGVGTLNILNDYYKDGSALTGFDITTYSTTPDIDQRLGRSHLIEPTDAVAFTVPNPTHAIAGDIVVITVKNTFGVLGGLSFGNRYKIGSGWTQPANGFQRSIGFLVDDGLVLHEIWRTAADVTN